MLLRYYGMVLLVLYKDLIYIYIVQEDRSTGVAYVLHVEPNKKLVVKRS